MHERNRPGLYFTVRHVSRYVRSIDDFKTVRQLYRCNASTVVKAVHVASNTTVAIKAYRKDLLSNDLKRCAHFHAYFTCLPCFTARPRFRAWPPYATVQFNEVQ